MQTENLQKHHVYIQKRKKKRKEKQIIYIDTFSLTKNNYEIRPQGSSNLIPLTLSPNDTFMRHHRPSVPAAVKALQLRLHAPCELPSLFQRIKRCPLVVWSWSFFNSFIYFLHSSFHREKIKQFPPNSSFLNEFSSYRTFTNTFFIISPFLFFSFFSFHLFSCLTFFSFFFFLLPSFFLPHIVFLLLFSPSTFSPIPSTFFPLFFRCFLRFFSQFFQLLFFFCYFLIYFEAYIRHSLSPLMQA